MILTFVKKAMIQSMKELRIKKMLIQKEIIGSLSGPRAQRISGQAADLHVHRRAGGQRAVQRRCALRLQRDDLRAPGKPRGDEDDVQRFNPEHGHTRTSP